MSPEVPATGQEIIAEEQHILARVRARLAQALPEGLSADYDRELLELRDSLAEAHEEDVPQILAMMDSLASLARHHRQETTARPAKLASPYFAHLRIEQEGRRRDILIGNASLLGSELPCPIVDWRQSPISRLYYAYREGDPYEEELGGKVVTGEVLAHRTVMIRDGVLMRLETPQGIFQRRQGQWRLVHREPPRLEGGAGTAVRAQTVHPLTGPVPQLGVDHEGLPREDKHLPEITALIDPEQFDLITRPESGVVVMDGGAGSGKTTIALHRIAWLHYRDPQRFRPDNILAVVYSRALARFVAHILPALGVEGVRIEVYDDFASDLRRRHYPALHAEYHDATPVAVLRFKLHPATVGYLDECIARRTGEIEADLTRAVAGTDSAERVATVWAGLAELPLAVRLERMTRWAAGKLALPPAGRFGGDWVAQRRLVRTLAEHLPDPNAPYSVPLSLWEEAFLHVEPMAEAMARLAPGEFTPGQLEEVQRWAARQLAQREAYAAWQQHKKERRAGGADADAEEEEPPVERAEPPLLDREDDTLLMLLYRRLVGPLRARRQKGFRLTHLMVDEAQDFSPLELQLLIDLVGEPRSVSLAGDTAQRMELYHSFESWESVLQQLGLDSVAVSPLRVGYRSTGEIMAFARHVLGDQAPERPWEAVRRGAPVELLRFTDPGQAVVTLSEALRRLMHAEPTAYVALISRHPERAAAYYEGLERAEVPRLRRVDDQNFAFEPGLEVTDVSQVKGLEFDYVVLLDADAATYPDDPASRYLLHIGATRAAHQLWLVACGEPSPLLPPEMREAAE